VKLVRIAGLEPANASGDLLLMVALLCACLPLRVVIIPCKIKGIVAYRGNQSPKNLCGSVRATRCCAELCAV